MQALKAACPRAEAAGRHAAGRIVCMFVSILKAASRRRLMRPAMESNLLAGRQAGISSRCRCAPERGHTATGLQQTAGLVLGWRGGRGAAKQLAHQRRA